ncbi:MAG TPA: 4-(cytidine 5'-diphospho)-2-C-methyl-D-erythritol kinase [Acidimicrobiales bacterium]|nr:4-(cytidine 5'-diphospho)-2-C-methyl-D-erythritol kinase [Acidimicrobiales bacterium]
MTVSPVTVSAPAKLTLSLRVTGRRGDGYHLLDAEMVSIDLVDALTFGPGAGVTVVDEVVGATGTGAVPVGPDNLVARALALLGRRASVRLVKRIPAGAGLGGGSTDAAAVLRWAGSDDLALAVRLGADVPFCVRGGRARVTGVGETVEGLPFEPRRFVLLLPPLSVSTAAVYGAWDENPSGHRGGPSRHAHAGNDLEDAALAVAPRLSAWRDRFADISGRRPRLAGSGSTWFVEGDPAEMHLEGREFLDLDGERAALRAVRTIPAFPDQSGP